MDNYSKYCYIYNFISKYFELINDLKIINIYETDIESDYSDNDDILNELD